MQLTVGPNALTMDLVHYSEEFPPQCKIVLCCNYPVLIGLSFVDVSQDLAVSQTDYIRGG